MTSIRLRSRWEPAVWLPVLAVVLGVLALAVWGHLRLSEWIEALDHAAASDPEQAAREAIRFIRLCELALCVVSAVFAVVLFRFFQLGLREARIPPSGWWSAGAWRVVVGPEAERMSRVGLVLTGLVLVASLAVVAVIEALLRSLPNGGAGG